MLNCTPEELALKDRFSEAYSRSQTPVMQAIERRVCGCDYGGNSWTTRDHADDLIGRLNLRKGIRLLDLGAGSGWPALYMASESGCHAVLVDLPEIGLTIALSRARELGIADRVSTHVMDAAELTFPEESFDVITHSDLLCCLIRKQAVLEECRRVIRGNGVMAFTVISIVPDLSAADYSRAVAFGPDFIESACNYTDLLGNAGWSIAQRKDLTRDYQMSCSKQLQADLDYSEELAALIGRQAAEERFARWHAKLSAIKGRLYRRELIVCVPDIPN